MVIHELGKEGMFNLARASHCYSGIDTSTPDQFTQEDVWVRPQCLTQIGKTGQWLSLRHGLIWCATHAVVQALRPNLVRDV